MPQPSAEEPAAHSGSANFRSPRPGQARPGSLPRSPRCCWKNCRNWRVRNRSQRGIRDRPKCRCGRIPTCGCAGRKRWTIVAAATRCFRYRRGKNFDCCCGSRSESCPAPPTAGGAVGTRSASTISATAMRIASRINALNIDESACYLTGNARNPAAKAAAATRTFSARAPGA